MLLEALITIALNGSFAYLLLLLSRKIKQKYQKDENFTLKVLYYPVSFLSLFFLWSLPITTLRELQVSETILMTLALIILPIAILYTKRFYQTWSIEEKDKMNIFFQKVFLGGLILSVVVFTVLNLSSIHDLETTDKPLQESSEQNCEEYYLAETEEEDKEVYQGEIHNLGDVVTTNKLELRVESVRNAESNGTDYGEIDSCATYVVPTLTIKNTGSEIYEYNGMFTTSLKDTEGVRYIRSAFMEDKVTGSSLMQVSIKPGQSVTGELVFEVPEKAKGLILIYSSLGINPDNKPAAIKLSN